MLALALVGMAGFVMTYDTVHDIAMLLTGAGAAIAGLMARDLWIEHLSPRAKEQRHWREYWARRFGAAAKNLPTECCEMVSTHDCAQLADIISRR